MVYYAIISRSLGLLPHVFGGKALVGMVCYLLHKHMRDKLSQKLGTFFHKSVRGVEYLGAPNF